MTTRMRFLRACECSMERLATDRHYFAKPVRTLFNDVRHFFPIGDQMRVYRVCERHMMLATEFVDTQLKTRHDLRRQPGVLPREHAAGHAVRARAAAGQQVLPVAQASRRRARGRGRLGCLSAVASTP